MKNLIEPHKIEQLKNQPATYETVAEFLKEEPKVLVCVIYQGADQYRQRKQVGSHAAMLILNLNL